MTALLQVREIRKRFGGVQAVDGCTLEVHEGEIVGLIGPNGAGKTTSFNLISGVVIPDSGTVHFADTDVTRLPAHLRASLGIGRSWQNLGLMATETVENNILAYLHRSATYSAADVLLRPWHVRRIERQLRERTARALSRFGLGDQGERVVGDLSFAKARTVELAAVFAEEPRLMLLDEPTTGLDPVEIAQVGDVLRQLREAGTAVLVVAHDVGFVMQVCDRVYVLAEGRPLFDGTPSEVRGHPSVAAAYLGRAA